MAGQLFQDQAQLLLHVRCTERERGSSLVDIRAESVYRLAKAGRKHWCGLTTVTQDIDDLLATDLGKAVIANASTQILLGQAPQAIGALTEAFNLSQGERAFLLAARRGEGILAAGQQRVAFHAEASPLADRLATTSPEFLAALEAEQDVAQRARRHRAYGPRR